MITIDDALNIEVSQGDTFSLKFKFKNYKLDADDKVVFSIKATTNSNEVVYTDSFYNTIMKNHILSNCSLCTVVLF